MNLGGGDCDIRWVCGAGECEYMCGGRRRGRTWVVGESLELRKGVHV